MKRLAHQINFAVFTRFIIYAAIIYLISSNSILKEQLGCRQAEVQISIRNTQIS